MGAVSSSDISSFANGPETAQPGHVPAGIQSLRSLKEAWQVYPATPSPPSCRAYAISFCRSGLTYPPPTPRSAFP